MKQKFVRTQARDSARELMDEVQRYCKEREVTYYELRRQSGYQNARQLLLGVAITISEKSETALREWLEQRREADAVRSAAAAAAAHSEALTQQITAAAVAAAPDASFTLQRQLESVLNQHADLPQVHRRAAVSWLWELA
jgi:hypothetical protein